MVKFFALFFFLQEAFFQDIDSLQNHGIVSHLPPPPNPSGVTVVIVTVVIVVERGRHQEVKDFWNLHCEGTGWRERYLRCLS